MSVSAGQGNSEQTLPIMSYRSFLLLSFVSRSAVYAAECTEEELDPDTREKFYEQIVPRCQYDDTSPSSVEAFCVQEGCYRSARGCKNIS